MKTFTVSHQGHVSGNTLGHNFSQKFHKSYQTNEAVTKTFCKSQLHFMLIWEDSFSLEIVIQNVPLSAFPINHFSQFSQETC